VVVAFVFYQGEGVNSWVVVRTKRGQEITARNQLLKQRFDTYLPLLKSRRRRLGQWFDAAEALFPGYLFVCVDLELQSVSPIRSTRGVLGTVRFGNCLAVIPGHVIQNLQATENAHADRLHRDPRRAFVPGGKVDLIAGRFSGLQGIFSERDGRRRAVVLVNFLGGASKINIPLDWIKKSA
jgi:transcriptional antiterminator RfaH